MTKQFGATVAAALAAVAIVVAIVWFANKKNHLVIDGKIVRVRAAAIDPKDSIVVVDFTVKNPSAVLFESKAVSLQIEPASGSAADGLMVSRGDVDPVFQAIPDLGPKYNDVFGLGGKIPPDRTRDFMVMARFELPTDQIENRKNLVLHLEDLDGAEADIAENQGK